MTDIEKFKQAYPEMPFEKRGNLIVFECGNDFIDQDEVLGVFGQWTAFKNGDVYREETSYYLRWHTLDDRMIDHVLRKDTINHEDFLDCVELAKTKGKNSIKCDRFPPFNINPK
jgi:hypothetical protein